MKSLKKKIAAIDIDKSNINAQKKNFGGQSVRYEPPEPKEKVNIYKNIQIVSWIILMEITPE